MTDSGSDRLRDELKTAISTYAFIGSGEEIGTDEVVVAVDDAVLMAERVVARRVAEATAPLEAKIVAVTALHRDVKIPMRGTSFGDIEYSQGCGECNELWPCATVRALASGQEGEQP